MTDGGARGNGPMSDQHPAPVPPGGSGLPARRLSSNELEAVIKRAVELQTARETEMTTGSPTARWCASGRTWDRAALVRRASPRCAAARPRSTA